MCTTNPTEGNKQEPAARRATMIFRIIKSRTDGIVEGCLEKINEES